MITPYDVMALAFGLSILAGFADLIVSAWERTNQ